MPPMSDFAYDDEQIALPKGAWARTHRRRLKWRGRTLLAVTQGDFRNYLYPLNTPAGFAVTSERPADHPHHASLWIGADHVTALMAATAGTTEEYVYNFYVDDTFQGRAPGRIVETLSSGRETAPSRFEIVQNLDWRGPVEWGAPDGREVARERRTTIVTTGERAHRIDVLTQLTASGVPLRLGPTRHALFNARMADALIVANGGAIRDDRGHLSGENISGDGARWVDFSGSIGGGHLAGLTIIPHPVPGRRPFWFVADWGVITVGPFRFDPLELAPGATFAAGCTFLVHDGEIADDEIAALTAGSGKDA